MSHHLASICRIVRNKIVPLHEDYTLHTICMCLAAQLLNAAKHTLYATQSCSCEEEDEMQRVRMKAEVLVETFQATVRRMRETPESHS